MQQGKEQNQSVVKCCNDLLAFEHVAIDGYKSAIDGLREEKPAIAEKLAELLTDHERHVRELEAHVRAFGGEPRTRPGVQIIFKKPLMEIKKMLGAESVMSGMVTNEEAAVGEYRDALDRAQKEMFPPDVADTFRRALEDEERHLAYCREQHRRLKDASRSAAEGFGTQRPREEPRPRPGREGQAKPGTSGSI